MGRLQKNIFSLLNRFSAILLSKYLTLIMIVFLAIITQVGFNYFSTGLDLNSEPKKDEIIFTNIAWNLISDNGYSINGELPTARRPPGYPFLLAGIFSVFGKNWVAARTANILLISLTIGITYLIGTKLFNRSIGFLSVLLISILYRGFYEIPLRMESDTLFLFLVSTVLVVFIKIYDRPTSWKLKLLSGILLGLAILTRSELILLIPFLFIWAVLIYYPRFGVALQTLALILIPISLLVLPWLVRNYIVFDRVLMATNLGRVMWGVYNPDTFTELDYMGGWHPPELNIRNAGEIPRREWNSDYEYLPEPEWDKQQIGLALISLKENLHLLPQMEVYKLYRFMYKTGAKETQNLLRLPLIYCFFFGLFLLGASGDKRFVIIYILLLYALCSTLIFYPNERFRLVSDPTIVVIACYGFSEQIGLIKERLAKKPDI